jgi:basic membrane protein A and related proteins
VKLGSQAPLFMLALCAALISFVPARNKHAQASTGALRVGLVLDVGGRGDKSFNDASFVGLERAAEDLGVSVTYVEPSGSEDRESALRLFASGGYDLVIGVGFIFSSDIDAVALDYPKVHFACIDYFPRGPVPDNVAALAFKEEEGSYLVGGVAGLLSKTKHVGFVGGMKGPLIRKFEAGFEAGVKEVCPSCTVHAAYAGSSPDAYHDPAKGKSLTLGQVASGADVVYHASGATGHGVFEAANDSKILAIGVDSDQHDEMPGVVVTSMTKRVDTAVFETIRSEKEQRFKGGFRVFGLKEDGVDYVHKGPHAVGISSDIRARIEQMRARVIRGEVHVPKE